jgi:hypothetical protein
MATINANICIRRDTSTNWTSNNPTMLVGEIGYETDTGAYKVGDGGAWNSTRYTTDEKITGTASNGFNRVANATVNSISVGTDSKAGTIAGGGNSAFPNKLLNTAAETACAYRTISGGYDNVIGSTEIGGADGAIASTVAGGAHHRIRRPTSTGDAPNPPATPAPATLTVPILASFSLDQPDHGTIGGGGYNAIRNGNYGVIAGGSSNVIMGEASTSSLYNNGYAASIVGGEGHWASGNNSTIGGGSANFVRQIYGTIAGGVNNLIRFLDNSLSINNASTIAGGSANKIYNAGGATICGGATNAIGASGDTTNDRGTGSTIAGGDQNSIGTNATIARYSSVGGGQLNTINTWWATVIGGYNNLVSPSGFPNGEYSVAMGRDAECQHHMTVVQGGGIFTGAIRGSAQTQTSVLKVATANATPTALALGGGPANAGELAMPSDCLWGFRVMVVGRQTTANTNCAWEITGLATNDAGTAAIVGTPTVTALSTVPTGWGSPTVGFSTSRLVFNVTGHATNPIRWVARAEITQVIS